MLNSMMNVAFTLTLFIHWCDIHGINWHPDQLGWTRYGVYGNGCHDPLIALTPQGDDCISDVERTVEIRAHESFVDHLRDILPESIDDHGIHLFKGVTSELEKVPPGGDLNTISKRFIDTGDPSQAQV